MPAQPRSYGPYQVERELGRGGMGLVYLARDTRLDRAVAVKVLPSDLADDHERLARFKREARFLASLSHPNVASVYGIEQAENGQTYLVMEYVEGRDLSEALQRGPLPIDEVLSICAQVAAGVEAAHEAGVIHRDLKPGNVIITEQGTAKVLDFGLAKESAPVSGSHAGAADMSTPTASIAAPATAAGRIMGTIGYMSPEQARGKPVDKRTDIFSFGCILYECLAGRLSFRGETSSDVLAAILEREPDWTALPSRTPLRVRELLRHCLEKDPRRRLRDIGDARITLQTAHENREWSDSRLSGLSWSELKPAPNRRWKSTVLTIAITAVAAGTAAWFARGMLAQDTASPAIMDRPREVTRLAVPLSPLQGEPAAFPRVTVSPDGRSVVYEDAGMLYLRRLDGFEAVPIAGSKDDHAYFPLFSPDGEWVAFFAPSSHQLRKVPTEGGTPMTMARLPLQTVRGAVWYERDSMILTLDDSLVRLTLSTGTIDTIAEPQLDRGEHAYRWPEVLPGGEWVLCTVWDGGSFNEAKIAAMRLRQDSEHAERHIVVERARSARYSPTGHLVYASEDALHAAPFDARTARLTGSPVPVLDGISTSYGTGMTDFALCRAGTLAFITGIPAPQNRFAWVDRKGNVEPAVETKGNYISSPSIAPDGMRIAYARFDGPELDIWVHDLERDVQTRLTANSKRNVSPIWSPDGMRIVYSSTRRGWYDLYIQDAHGLGPAELLVASSHHKYATSWSPDGKYILYSEMSPEKGQEIKWIGVGDRAAAPLGAGLPLVDSPHATTFGQFSPDGRWVAYMMNETGRMNVYIQRFPEGGRRWQVSATTGLGPMWNPRPTDGPAQLFFSDGMKLLSVDIAFEPSVQISRPQVASEESPGVRAIGGAIAPDGERMLVLQLDPTEHPVEVRIVANWTDELDRRLARGVR